MDWLINTSGYELFNHWSQTTIFLERRESFSKMSDASFIGDGQARGTSKPTLFPS